MDTTSQAPPAADGADPGVAAGLNAAKDPTRLKAGFAALEPPSPVRGGRLAGPPSDTSQASAIPAVDSVDPGVAAASDADPGMPAQADAVDPGVAAAGPPRSKIAELRRDPEEREKLRWMVEESTLSLGDIAKHYGVARSTISRWVERLGFTRRPDAPKKSVRRHGGLPRGQSLADSMDDVEAVKSRLIRAVDRQIAKIDTRVRKKDATVEEKDARTLGTLAKTLQTLIALDGDAGAKLQQPEPLDRDELRAALARRFSIWAEQGGRPE